MCSIKLEELCGTAAFHILVGAEEAVAIAREEVRAEIDRMASGPPHPGSVSSPGCEFSAGPEARDG
jgi:hypothetical protein